MMDDPTSTKASSDDGLSKPSADPDNPKEARQTIVLGREIQRPATTKFPRNPPEGTVDQTLVLGDDARADEGLPSKTEEQDVTKRTAVLGDLPGPIPDGSLASPNRDLSVAKTISLDSPTAPARPSGGEARDDNVLARTMVLDAGPTFNRGRRRESADEVQGGQTIPLNESSEAMPRDDQDTGLLAVNETIDFVAENFPEMSSGTKATAEDPTPAVGLGRSKSPSSDSSHPSQNQRTASDSSVNLMDKPKGTGTMADYLLFPSGRRDHGDRESQVETREQPLPSVTATPADDAFRGPNRLISRTKRQLWMTAFFLLVAISCATMSSIAQSYTYVVAVLAWGIGAAFCLRYLRNVRQLQHGRLPR